MISAGGSQESIGAFDAVVGSVVDATKDCGAGDASVKVNSTL